MDAARTHDSPSDEALLARVSGGDREAFSTLAERHGPKVLALARRMLRNEADAQDIVQDVFIRLWQQAGNWEARGARLSTWLHRVTSNLCLNHIERVQKRTVPMDETTIQITDPAPAIDESLGAAQRELALNAAIDALPTRQRAAMALFYSVGASTAETAQALGLSIKATESLLVRARQALRRQLAALEEVST